MRVLLLTGIFSSGLIRSSTSKMRSSRTGCVTGYDMDDDNEGVTVIYGEYRTQLKDIVKYQPEMAENAA